MIQSQTLRSGSAALLLACVTLAPLLIPSLATPSWADVEKGRAAFTSGDAPLALQEFIASADAGDPQGQFLAGQMLVQGQGVPKDVGRGIALLEKATTAGHLQAMVMAGTVYAYGDGIEPDYDRALRYLKPAAEAGDVHAQNNLAVLYNFGLGTKLDPVQAMAWAMRAERQGLLQAIQLRQEIEAGLTLAQKSEALRLAGQPLPGNQQVRMTSLPPATPAKSVAGQPSLAQQAQQPRAAPLVAAPATPSPTAPAAAQPASPATSKPAAPQKPAVIPTPEPVKPAAPAPSTGEAIWSVQVGALPSEVEAQREWRVIQGKIGTAIGGEQPVFTQVDLGSKGVMTRILLGRFGTSKDATAFCNRIKEAGRDCLIRRQP